MPGWSVIKREPLVFFLLIGISLFAFDAYYNNENKQKIIIDEVLRAAILEQEAALKGSSLSVLEQERAVGDFIDNKILFDEAVRLGLDRDRNIEALLVRKYLALITVAHPEPSEDDLRGYYQDNQQNYLNPRLYDVQKYFSPPTTNSDLALSEKENIPISTQLDVDLLPIAAGEPELLFAMSERELLIRMGKNVADVIVGAERNRLYGPIKNYRGTFYVRVVTTTDSVPKPYAEVERYLRDAWIRARQEKLVQENLIELKKNYDIEFSQE